jgi:hypothetical protein
VSALPRVVFWTGAVGAGWVLAGYPAALAALPRRPWRTGPEQPLVTIVIPAYREREELRRKLEALGDLDYPAERLQVIVAVDEDEELAALVTRARPDAEVSFGAERAGKAAALRRALEGARGTIVLLTDANNVLEPESVAAAVRHFADPAVWAVAGRRGELGSAYDRYEDLIRRLETRSGSVAAMSGEFMAVRRERLPEFPAHVVNDDLWLLGRLVRDGGRVVYEPQAASTEEAIGARAELARRSRIGAGRAMLVGELAGLPPGFALRLISHKHGRLALPLLLALALGGALAGARGSRLLRAAAVAQLAGYGLGACAGAGVPLPPGLDRAGRASWQFTLGNAAVAMGVVRAWRGRQDVRWESVR